MKKTLFLILIFFISAVFISCASTKMTGYKDSETKISKYKKMVVYADIENMELCSNIENELVTLFESTDTNVVSSLEIISPLKEYTQAEKDAVLKENDVMYQLSIRLLNSGTKTSGGYILYGVFINETVTEMNFEITLKELESGDIIMKYQAASSYESDIESNSTIIKRISKSLAKKVFAEVTSMQY